MNREQIESLIRRAYDIGYKEGLYDSKKTSETAVDQMSDEDMTAKWLEENEVTVIEPSATDDPTQTSQMRQGD